MLRDRAEASPAAPPLRGSTAAAEGPEGPGAQPQAEAAAEAMSAGMAASEAPCRSAAGPLRGSGPGRFAAPNAKEAAHGDGAAAAAAAPLPSPLLPPPPLPPVPKPPGWEAMPMYRKIAHYGGCLGPLHAALADKLRAKRYVLGACAALGLAGAVTTAPVLRELEGWADLRPEDLLRGRMVKATHGCKWQVLGTLREVRSPAALAAAERARETLRGWSGRAWTSATSPQRHYALIPPRFFVEAVLPDALAPPGEALCYMVRCVRGRPVSLSVLRGRRQNSYDPAAAAATGTRALLRQIPDYDPPRALRAALLRAAAALAAPFEFVRVDFHVPRPRAPRPLLFFSEFTFTPAAGARVFDEAEEQRQGALWGEL
jgi:hypothetical protein